MNVAEKVRTVPADFDEIEKHINHVHARAAHAFRGVANPGLLQLSRVHPAEDKLTVIGRYQIGDAEKMAWDAQIEADSGFNVYIEGRTVSNALRGNSRGKAEDTVGVFALVADSDGYKGKAADRRGAPSVVQSSPGNEHLWYFLDRALPFDKAAELGKALRGAGGDSDTGNPSQPYRVAGTPNFPSMEKRRKYNKVDAPTKVLTLSAEIYSADAFAALWPSQAVASKEPAVASDDGERDFDILLARCSDQLKANLSEDEATNRSDHFHKTTGFIRREGFTVDQALILWEGHPEGVAGKYEGRLAAEVKRSWGKVKDRPKPQADDLLTEETAATIFATKFGDLYRFCHGGGTWFEWNGACWVKDETGKVPHLLREIVRAAASGRSSKSQATAGRYGFIRGAEGMARNDTVFAVNVGAWDRDPWLLGTPGGTVNLRTGELREPEPAEGITRQTFVAPAATAECPLWLAFLDQATGSDAVLVRFLQQWCGYCLTGVTTEQVLLFIFGDGGNGKGVTINILRRLLNTYAATAAMDTFTASKFEKHATDLAMLRGARLVTASETEQGHAWAESRIKQMTGGDPITARFMRQDNFTFLPQFKLTIVGNHKPVLKNVDAAARRRFNIVPFTRKPEIIDRDLEEKLTAELPGILRWMIDGCLDWQQNGLTRPSVVLDETEAYFAEQDVFTQWLDTRCELIPGNPNAFETSQALFNSWSDFARAAREEAGTVKAFAANMRRKALEPGQISKGRGYRGIRLRREFDESAA